VGQPGASCSSSYITNSLWMDIQRQIRLVLVFLLSYLTEMKSTLAPQKPWHVFSLWTFTDIDQDKTQSRNERKKAG